MRLFESFKSKKEFLFHTPFVNVYSVKCDHKEYTVIVTRKIANKHTVLHFIDNTIYWQQASRIPRLMGNGERIAICKFDTENIANTIFVVRGNPLGAEGLDNGIFRSSKKYDEMFVNCLSYKMFKNM